MLPWIDDFISNFFSWIFVDGWLVEFLHSSGLETPLCVRSCVWLIIFVIIFALSKLYMSLRYSTKLSEPWWKTIHLTAWKMRFYNTKLNPKVNHAKHAIAIDEHRKSFNRVPWSGFADRVNSDKWFEQVWFAGNHSDVGGSYPENESRLSDISLEWMIDRAAQVEHPLQVDRKFLNLHPASGGIQHDETRSSWIPWPTKLRDIPSDAVLHKSVFERFTYENVINYNQARVYRPENLRDHEKLQEFEWPKKRL
ncbi:MAG: phospholipase effector Tle1 domain-containing protein [Hyphomicrobiales bacterium]